MNIISHAALGVPSDLSVVSAGPAAVLLCSDCTACDFGTTTEGVGKGFNKSSCGIARGYGLVDGKIQLCPIGEILFNILCSMI